jgi:hypothetical protein
MYRALWQYKIVRPVEPHQTSLKRVAQKPGASPIEISSLSYRLARSVKPN